MSNFITVTMPDAPPITTYKIQAKIVNCTESKADHRAMETKIATEIAKATIQNKGEEVTGAAVLELVSKIGVTYLRERNTYVISISGEQHAAVVTNLQPAPVIFMSRTGVNYTLKFMNIDFIVQPKKTTLSTIYKSTVTLKPGTKETEVAGDLEMKNTAKIEAIVTEQAKTVGLNVIRFGRALNEIGGPVTNKWYADFDADDYLRADAPWKGFLNITITDTQNNISINFKETTDATSGKTVNPIADLGICLTCGKTNREYGRCTCEKPGSRKRKAGSSKEDALAALMGM